MSIRDFAARGTHDWDMHLEYHRCPSCGYIEECRKPYEARFERFEKDRQCGRCGYVYTVNRFRMLPQEPLLERSENG